MHIQIAMLDPAVKTRRLFIGLVPGADVRQAIDTRRRQWPWPPKAQLPAAQCLHLTLNFLDEVPGDRLPELQETLARVPMHPFRLVLRRAECWRHVAVLRPEPSEALGELHDRLVLKLWRLGLPARAAWTPHVTVAREPDGALLPPDIAPVHWPVTAFSLVWSRRAPVARHEVLSCYTA